MHCKFRCHTFIPIKDYKVLVLKISVNVLLVDLDLKQITKANIFAEFRIYQSLGRRNHKVDQNLFPVLQ